MEEVNEKGVSVNSVLQEEEDNGGVFSFQFIYSAFILHWKWFVLSVIIFVGCAAIYLRYNTPVFMASAKMLIKEEAGSRGNSIRNATNLGIMSNSSGFDNELELLKSHSMATEAVTDIKLYTSYYLEGRVKDRLVYRMQPISVDIDMAHLTTLTSNIYVDIERNGNKYDIDINFNYNGRAYGTKKSNVTLPSVIRTKAGVLTFTANGQYIGTLPSGKKLKVVISNPASVASGYAYGLSVSPASSTTTIALLSIKNESPQRAIDYLRQLAVVYNRQANEDKNEVAVRTEEFINSRIAKIDNELGSTDGAIESYKRRNNMIDVGSAASTALSNTNSYEKQLADANTQIALMSSISEYINQPSNQYQTLPSNVGLNDGAATSLITEYNRIVLERNRLLHTASEMSPAVQAYSSQLDDLMGSIKNALQQARRTHEITRNAMAQQYAKYNGQISQTPEQERVLTQIGRQQEVKSGLYLMLLQKREENSISLAATADKGKLIDDPVFSGKVSPDEKKIYGVAFLIGFFLPIVIIILLELLRYRIEGHEDVVRLTRLPVIADVAVASETAKEKADIVVHENKNNQMEEIFRSMRTNMQFILSEHEKVILLTSSTSGEGKTFIAANLAVSFALLGKKVLLVGLDIRRPRLNQLFEIDDRRHGITNLLSRDNVTREQVIEQIIPSEVNDNLEILMAGPVPPNPAELVTRKSLDDTFSYLREMYDYILIDTAPVGLVTDTLSIGRVADATIFVTRSDYTSKSSILMLNQLADEEKLPKICITINGIDLTKKKYGYQYGYGKYGKYGRYGNYSYGSGRYGRYGRYGKYGYYGGYSYGSYSSSHYANPDDDSIKK